jgi:hypothetical protein
VVKKQTDGSDDMQDDESDTNTPATPDDERTARRMQEIGQQDYNERVWGGRIGYGRVIPGTGTKGKGRNNTP